MRLAFINHTLLSGGGPDRVICEIAKRLKNKYDITLLSSRSDLNIEGTNKDFFYCPRIFGFSTPIPTPVVLKKLGKFELVNIHYLPFMYLSLFSTVPKILTFHGWTDVPEGEQTSMLMMSVREKILRANGRLTRFNTIVVAVSEYLKRIAEEWTPNVCVIPNGVDTELYKPGQDKGYMLFVGRLVRYKGVHELIQAVSNVGIKLHVVGSGPELPQLMKLANKLHVDDKVQFLGGIPEKCLIEEYRNCSFFVSASKWEGFGIPFLEANACAKPVIGYDRAAIRERIMNEHNGFLVSNYKELLESVRILAWDDGLRKSMGSRGRKIAENYSWNLIAESYNKMIQRNIS
jgi:glycosyltransferase involved in cell wall biosynthesis